MMGVALCMIGILSLIIADIRGPRNAGGEEKGKRENSSGSRSLSYSILLCYMCTLVTLKRT